MEIKEFVKKILGIKLAEFQEKILEKGEMKINYGRWSGKGQYYRMLEKLKK